jgi:hypothetical protein
MFIWEDLYESDALDTTHRSVKHGSVPRRKPQNGPFTAHVLIWIAADFQHQFMILTNPLQTQGLALSLNASPPAFQAWGREYDLFEPRPR